MFPTDEIQPNFKPIQGQDNIITSPSGANVQNRAMVSPNYAKGVAGWRLDSNGEVEINNLALVSKFRATRTSDQTLALSAVTQIQFNIETFDALSEFSTSAYRFVVQNAGYYFIHAQVYIATTNLVDQSELGIILKKNGSNFVSSSHQTSGTGAVTIKVNDLLSLAKNDYIEVFVNNTIAAALTATGDSALTYFSGFRVL